MSWINEVDVSEAAGKLAENYAALIKQRGKVSNILKVHSLNPATVSSAAGLLSLLLPPPQAANSTLSSTACANAAKVGIFFIVLSSG